MGITFYTTSECFMYRLSFLHFHIYFLTNICCGHHWLWKYLSFSIVFLTVWAIELVILTLWNLYSWRVQFTITVGWRIHRLNPFLLKRTEHVENFMRTKETSQWTSDSEEDIYFRQGQMRSDGVSNTHSLYYWKFHCAFQRFIAMLGCVTTSQKSLPANYQLFHRCFNWLVDYY